MHQSCPTLFTFGHHECLTVNSQKTTPSFFAAANYKVLFIRALERHWLSLPLAPNPTVWAGSPPQHITHTLPRAQSQADCVLTHPTYRPCRICWTCRTPSLSPCSALWENCDFPDSSLSVVLRYLKFLMSLNQELATATKRSLSKPFHLAVCSAPIQPSASRG